MLFGLLTPRIFGIHTRRKKKNDCRGSLRLDRGVALTFEPFRSPLIL
jgi:hypothetical protein